MEPDPSIFTREAYQDILAQIREAGWQSHTECSPHQLTDRVLSGDQEEQFQFHLPQCHPTLQVIMPDYVGGNVCQVGVVNPLDRGLSTQSPASEFLNQIARAHQSIGERHQQGYVTPVEDQTTVYTGSIPPGYSEETLTDTIRACARASIETHHLRSTLYNVIQAYN